MTILGGVHTLVEVNDIIRAKDTEIGVVDKNYSNLKNDAWKASAEGQKWLSDWKAFKFKWGAAKGAAKLEDEMRVTSRLLPDSMVPAETEYAELVAAAEGIASVPNMTAAYLAAIPGPLGAIGGITGPAIQEGVVHPGGLQDLFNRLSSVSASLGAEDMAISHLIQPTPHTDVDLEVFKATDRATKTAKKATPWVMIGIAAAIGGYALITLRRPAVVIRQERAFPPMESL